MIRRIVLLLLVAHFVVGACFLVQNLGKVPHYPDTREQRCNDELAPGYVRMAKDGLLDARRGLLYPFVLRLTHSVGGGDWLEGVEIEDSSSLPAEAIECWAPAWQTRTQLLQLLAFAGVLIYAARVFAVRSPRSLNRSAFLVAAIFFDPFLLHSQLSLMPDGPAVSACLLFAAGWVEFTRDGRRRGLLVLCVGAALAAGLRPEKGLVLLVASAVTSLALVLRRAKLPGLRPRLALGLVIVSALWFGASSIAGAIQRSSGVSPISEIVTHTRVVYPHLEELQPLLPASLQAEISPAIARRYDRSPSRARNCIRLLSRGNPARRAELTSELRSLALRERGGAILLDCLTDTAQNLVPVPSLLVRWHLWNRAGADVTRIEGRFYESLVLWGMLAYHEPGWASLAFWTSSIGLIGFSLAAAIAALRSRKRWLFDARDGATWVPVLMLVGANAAAFAFTQDLFEVRYVHLSHLLLLAAVFAGTWAYLVGEPGTIERRSTSDSSARPS